MSNPSTGTSSKSKVGSSQPSETSFKRKRGVFQKDCKHIFFLYILPILWVFLQVFFCFLVLFIIYIVFALFVVTVQHMIYGFGDDPNVSILQKFNIFKFVLFLIMIENQNRKKRNRPFCMLFNFCLSWNMYIFLAYWL